MASMVNITVTNISTENNTYCRFGQRATVAGVWAQIEAMERKQTNLSKVFPRHMFVQNKAKKFPKKY